VTTTVNTIGQALEARRTELGWTQRDLSHQSGVSLTTISAIERGARDNFQTVTLNALDRALGWPHGTLEAIQRGEQPPERGSVSTPTASYHATQMLASVVAHLGDSQVERLLIDALRMQNGGGETYRFEGVVSHLSDMSGSGDTLTMAVLNGPNESWALTIKATHPEVPTTDRRLGIGDEIVMIFQRM
jgi:transcriptional regulator with XRE-family HTH domain